jgi:hypothetical protein
MNSGLSSSNAIAFANRMELNGGFREHHAENVTIAAHRSLDIEHGP